MPAAVARGRRRLLSGLLATLLQMPGASVPAAAAAAAAEPCPATPFRSTLMQLLRHDAERPEAEWLRLMRDLRRLGLREVVVQWTSIDDTDFYGGHPSAEEVLPVLPTILRAAHSAGLRLWIGLHEDSKWWSAATRSDPELDAWLAQRLADLDGRLPALTATLAGAPAGTVAGWYVTDELDDGTWAAPGREAALLRYLRAATDRLRRVAPGRPVAISAFANGAVQDGARYGAQLRRLAQGAGIGRLWLQDGIGAGKCTLDQAHATAQAVAHALRGSRGGPRLGMVVELFDMNPAPGAGRGEAATVPAPLPAMLTRLAATAGIGDLPAASFSHVHHLSAFGGAEAAARGEEWSRLLARCGGR